MRKVGRILLGILGILLVLILIILAILRVNSPGRLKPLQTETGELIVGALSEKGEMEIGGIKQGFFIRSEHVDNPVILYLHGGPGSPELPMIEEMEKTQRLEKYFTVCYWDQRGAGMTYSGKTDPGTMIVSQFVEDTREMTDYLIKRFGKKKIYLMGHSWGSYLGVKTIEKYPEYYHAFIGIGQVTNQLLSEQLAYDYMLDYANRIGDKKAVKQLKKFDSGASDFPTQRYLLDVRTKYMNKYGVGITHDSFSMPDFLYDIVMFKGYTFAEKIKYAKGAMFSLENVFDYVINDNLYETSNSFCVPVYVIHGLYDYQVSYELAKKWLNDVIIAPDKMFYTFEHSAHSPNIEEPERFVNIVREIADKIQDKTIQY